jgi:hypothetical protein
VDEATPAKANEEQTTAGSGRGDEEDEKSTSGPVSLPRFDVRRLLKLVPTAPVWRYGPPLIVPQQETRQLSDA